MIFTCISDTKFISGLKKYNFNLYFPVSDSNVGLLVDNQKNWICIFQYHAERPDYHFDEYCYSNGHMVSRAHPVNFLSASQARPRYQYCL